MKNVLLLLVLFVVGCTTSRQDRTIELVKPEVPYKTIADTAGDLDEKAMSYASASVTVAKELLLQGKIVIASKELDVALANLVKPNIDYIVQARDRVAKNDDQLFLSAIKHAEQLQKQSDRAWFDFEQERGKNFLLQEQLKAQQIQADAKAKQDRIDSVSTKCTWLGGILMLLGVASFALSSYLPVNKLTAPICIGVGSILIALPIVLVELIEWEYFPHVILSCIIGSIVTALVYWYKKYETQETKEH